MKKARSTQELLNNFPSWARMRNDWQSVGAQYLNTLGVPIDDMDEYLEKMRRNTFLTAINLDEADWVYRVYLPATFSFNLDSTDKINPSYIVPTVQGLVNNNIHSGYYTVSLAEDNSLEEMLYKTAPDRIDYQETITGYDSLLHLPSSYFPYSGILNHHLSDGGKLFIETSSGTQYISINDDGEIDRAKITLYGKTRKGTRESETLVFPWDQKQPTSKEWKYIDYIEAENLEDSVSVDIRSANFDWGPYLSFYNMRWSVTDKKIDEFWDIGSLDNGTTLDLIGYISDDWQSLMFGFSSKETKEQWELIDIGLNKINAVDLAIQPFQDRAWVVDSSKLYCFDLNQTMCSGVDFLAKRTDGSHFQLEAGESSYVLGDDITFTPLHIRAVSQVSKYRIWYQDPTGTKYGLNQGSQVSFSSDFWQYPTQLKRELEGEITISATERGEYKIALEVVYPDGTTFINRLLIPVQYKQPLSTIDIAPYISGNIEGIDFDSDQQLWIKTDEAYYRFSLHKDLMIIDYADKIVYFREEYDEVNIT